MPIFNLENMKILIVSATDFEVADLKNKMVNGEFEHDLEFLITGVGIPYTILKLSLALNKTRYDLVINAGIAGALNLEKHPIGSVRYIEEDRFADIGATFPDGHFEDLFEMGLWKNNQTPFQGELLVSDQYKAFFHTATALTINTVSGDRRGIDALFQKYNCELESMEGAAVFFTCHYLNQSCIQIRSISNKIDIRDKSSWNIPLALTNLNKKIEEFLLSI